MFTAFLTPQRTAQLIAFLLHTLFGRHTTTTSHLSYLRQIVLKFNAKTFGSRAKLQHHGLPSGLQCCVVCACSPAGVLPNPHRQALEFRAQPPQASKTCLTVRGTLRVSKLYHKIWRSKTARASPDCDSERWKTVEIPAIGFWPVDDQVPHPWNLC